VPTNAVLFVYGPELTSPGSVQLVDELGEVVPIEVQPVVPSGLDVTPLSDLSPERRYELRAVGSYGSDSVPFTTGSGPALVPERMSAPEFDVVQFSYSLGSCGTLAALCMETSPAAQTTLEARVGAEVLALGAAGPVPPPGTPQPLSRAYSQPLSDSDCVEVRARDVRGRRSAPRTLCGEAIARFELRDNNLDTAYTCDNYLDHVRVPGPEPEGVTPDELSAPVAGSNGPSPENASAPRDVTYITDRVGTGELTGSDTVIYVEEPSVHSSRGCALGSRAADTGPRDPGRDWLAFGLALAPLLGAAVFGARRRS
jgi:hypothetical protein